MIIAKCLCFYGKNFYKRKASERGMSGKILWVVCQRNTL